MKNVEQMESNCRVAVATSVNIYMCSGFGVMGVVLTCSENVVYAESLTLRETEKRST